MKWFQRKQKKVVMTDPMTGLHNRNYFHYTYGELSQLKNTAYQTMAVFDLDHFKAANDLINGDNVIRDVARLAKEIIGNKGELMRWGGDEFMAMISMPPEEALHAMKKFAEEVNMKTPVTVSVGLVEIRPEDTTKTNYYRAVQRCYLVKEMGGNGVKL